MTHFKLPRSAFIGFDNIFDELERISTVSAQDNYPPHNIVRLSENEYAIELAVVGFREEDLELKQQEGILYVTGNKANPSNTDYLHRGISGRAFKRSFRLSEHVEVKGADLRDGLLVIKLERVVPEEKRPRTIPINQSVEKITHDTEDQDTTIFLSEDAQVSLDLHS
jgi:molecular chaperone IbpA